MSMRISETVLVAVLLALTGCGQQSAPPPPDPNAPDTVSCRVNGAAEVAPLCRRENAGDKIVIRHPDGGFRRFQVVDDGRGIIAADGSDTAKVERLDKSHIRVTVSGDIYELPATIVATS